MNRKENVSIGTFSFSFNTEFINTLIELFYYT